LSYACSCGEAYFCEHLCAVLFYFQRDTLAIAVKKITKKTKVKTLELAIRPNFSDFLNSISQPDLLNFISNYYEANELFKENFQAWFLKRREDNRLESYRIRVKTVLERYVHHDKLTQQQIGALHRKLTKLINETGLEQRKKEDFFCLWLAIMAELPAVFNQRFLGDEASVLCIIDKGLDNLNLYFEDGLSKSQKQDWFKVCISSCAIKNKIALKILNFLVPRALSFLKSKTEFEQLKNQIYKRRIKLNVGIEFDSLEIIKLELAIKEAELFNTAFPFKKYRHAPEFIIAQAELFFSADKTEIAFKTLDQFYQEIKADHAGFIFQFLEYTILQARGKNNTLLELKYLEESMIYGIYISAEQAKRYIGLMESNDRKAAVDRLIMRIKERLNDQSLDKIATILLSDNRFDDLISELKNHKNKFPLVHKIALLKLPEFDTDFLKIYNKHLSDTLTDGTYAQYHEQIFLTAKKYLDQLPLEKTLEIVNQTLNKLGSFSQIAKFIKMTYSEKVKTVKVNRLRGKE